MSSPPRPSVSVLMITLNEERMLDRVLQSVRWADEIVIVDSGSTDATPEIARRHGARFHTMPYQGHGVQRQRTYERSKGDWILYIDADEVVTPELRDSIRSAVANPGDFAGFRMQLHTWMFGEWFGRKGWRKEWKVRLFRRNRGRFDARTIHEGAQVDGPIGTLEGSLLHYPYRDVAHFVEKMNRYSTAMADARLATGRRSSAAGAIGRACGRFFRDYVLGGDFLHGSAGLMRSALHGYYTFLKYAKLWEPGRGAHRVSDSPGQPQPPDGPAPSHPTSSGANRAPSAES
jgi:(heptosyl)LPS beta-1,4-glucosyltransferase